MAVEKSGASLYHPAGRHPAVDRADLIDRLRAFFASHPLPLAAAWLFGSEARGDARASSDVDVAVLLAELPDDPWARLAIGFDLASALERALDRDVDVVIMNDAAPDLAHRVLRDGVLVNERDPQARVEFEVRSRNEYFDIVPLLRLYRGFAGDEP